MNKDSRQQKWPMSQFIFKRNNNIVQNSTLVQKKPIISSSTTQNLSPLIRQQQKRNSVIPATHYLTVSSEETEFTFTELDGEDLVDVDYISDYSVDLSNDEDDEVCLCFICATFHYHFLFLTRTMKTSKPNCTFVISSSLLID